jgi:hypothetical protein
MAIPLSVETPRTLALRNIVDRTDALELLAWDRPTEADLALFGRIIYQFSAVDFVLQTVVDTMKQNQMLNPQWAKQTSKLPAAKLTEVVTSSPMWSDNHRAGFHDVDDWRRVRNLVAHFVIRRFPNDDAFLFLTKSAYDYKQVYGDEPANLETALYGVAEAEPFRQLVPRLKMLARWLGQLPGDLSRPVSPPASRLP